MHKFSVSEMSAQQKETMTLSDLENSAVQWRITKRRRCIQKGAGSVAFKLSASNLKPLQGFISFHGRFVSRTSGSKRYGSCTQSPSSRKKSILLDPIDHRTPEATHGPVYEPSNIIHERD
jgi:hypothetical protein